ncbi:MAG: hypothetical protein P8L18_03135 [Verrucomicrobiota bacterium]|nr:hypothetical protein [Verrucomicrobiota bacterium]
MRDPSTSRQGMAKAGRRRKESLPHAFLLTGRQWTCVILCFIVAIWGLPHAWKILEPFKAGTHYRVPYEASQDYWQYERHLEQKDQPNTVFFVGDSVVWGEYVAPEGTWTAFMNDLSGKSPLFVNLAMNGLYPLALEGLMDHYGGLLKGHKVILHCNLLWMSSPQADLSLPKEQVFNHPTLIPQFQPEIPSYRASIDTRLGRAIGHRWAFLTWVRHLQIQYWDRNNPYAWTLAEDGQYPPSYPNTYRMPWQEIDLHLLEEPHPDPERGTTSRRHRPWSLDGNATQHFEWVKPGESLQWQAFQRLCERIQQRENALLVVLGPFNRHIMTPENLETFKTLENEVHHWFKAQDIPSVTPPPLASELYGDASHPLTEGYRQLAGMLWRDPVFEAWIMGH